MSNDPNQQKKRQFRLTSSSMGLSLRHNQPPVDNGQPPLDTSATQSSPQFGNLPQSTQKQDTNNTWPNASNYDGKPITTRDVKAQSQQRHVKYQTSNVYNMGGSGSVTGTITGSTGSADSGTIMSLMESNSNASQMSAAQCVTSTNPLSTAHYRERLQKYREESARSGGDAAQIHCDLNDVFVKRLEDIDCLSVDDLNLRLITYQEWVDLLLHLNSTIFGNITKMEAEAFGFLRECFCKVNSEQQEAEQLQHKLRKDICTLIRIIQNGYNNNCWNLEGVHLETLEINQIIKPKAVKTESDMEQHVKALASEVAEKYDEVCQLRSQILCLENDIQVAHQKIIFKDEAIARLRVELEQAAATEQQTQSMPTTDEPCALSYASELAKANSETQYDCLTQSEHLESNLLKILEKELSELFEMNGDEKVRSLCCHRKRLGNLFQKLWADRKEACRRLSGLREQLLNLELNNEANGVTRKLSTACGCGSGSDDIKTDTKIIETLKSHLNCHNAHQLQQKLNESEYKSKMYINDINCRVLKQIAYSISEISGEEFTYRKIYEEGNDDTSNPFCAEISRLCENAKAKQRIDELATHSGDCPHRAQLEHTLRICQDQTALIAATRDNYLNIIDEFKHDLDELTLEVQQQQQQCHIDVENTCEPDADSSTQHRLTMAVQALEAHNERLQQALQDTTATTTLSNQLSLERVLMLEKNNEQLTCEVVKLTEMLSSRDRQITQLNSKINSYSEYVSKGELNKELSEMKIKYSKQSESVCELLKENEIQHTELSVKYKNLLKTYEEQQKQLKNAANSVKGLRDRFHCMEKTQDELKMERKLLREEVFALKEKEACLLGREKSLYDQLKRAEADICKASQIIREMQCIIRSNDEAHADIVNRLQTANAEAKRHLSELIGECKQLQMELKQQVDINKQSQELVASYRTWKKKQIETDESTRISIKKADEHIGALIIENDQCKVEYQKLQSDFLTLQNELLKNGYKNTSNNNNNNNNNSSSSSSNNKSTTMTTTATTSAQGGHNNADGVATRLKLICDTTQRLQDQQRVLRYGGGS